jgi:hypothetical protein
MTTNAMTFGFIGPDLLLSAKLSASSFQKISMTWHTLATRNQHHSSASLFSITHQTHMEDIQGSGGS